MLQDFSSYPFLNRDRCQVGISPEMRSVEYARAEAQTENDFAIVFMGSKSFSLSSGSSMKPYLR